MNLPYTLRWLMAFFRLDLDLDLVCALCERCGKEFSI